MPPPAPIHPVIISSLSRAIIGSSIIPLLLLDRDLMIIAASDSFCVAYDIDPETVGGLPMATIGDCQWAVPQLTSLLSATAAGFAAVDAYEMDMPVADGPPRKLVINAHLLDYAEDDKVRMLVAIGDVTDERDAAKLKDDLLREKAVLLQELQHRVANSLQIVASVLIQSARKVQSEEAREHLTDAHSRVMSIAALQTQLTTSRSGNVALQSYLTALCDSIGASMIHDRESVRLSVTTDGSATNADVSVSLGLIVTELVINALKHAFPGRPQKGVILVDFRSDGPAWTLSISDDGVGMPSGPDKAKPGLGTSIVAALAQQLRATVSVASANPGTTVSIVHDAQPLASARAL